MPATMTRPRKKASKSYSGKHTSPREAFHLTPELSAALKRYVDDTSPETTKTAVLKLALEQYLTAAGYWPPPEPPAGGD